VYYYYILKGECLHCLFDGPGWNKYGSVSGAIPKSHLAPIFAWRKFDIIDVHICEGLKDHSRSGVSGANPNANVAKPMGTLAHGYE
jgi:hypothetical protein